MSGQFMYPRKRNHWPPTCALIVRRKFSLPTNGQKPKNENFKELLSKKKRKKKKRVLLIINYWIFVQKSFISSHTELNEMCQRNQAFMPAFVQIVTASAVIYA